MLKSDKNKSVVPLSAGLIVLSLGLFIAGMRSHDFNAPSSLLILLSFVILCGLAIVLTVVVARTAISSAAKSASGRGTVKHDKKTAGPAAAERVDQSTQLFSETAGELRTSVDVIQEELEEILDDDIPADKEQIESLYDETDRLKKIIVGMEQLSQAQALARSLKKDRVELNPLLNGVIEKTRTAFQDKNITFGLECETGLAMTANPDSLNRILGNLMDNAAKAVKDAGSVTLAALRKGDMIVFSVKDAGPGISRKQLPHIYERFFRGTGSGIGMGLAIVKELVDACGGKIEVQTKAGEGTIFTVHIPEA